MTGRELLEALKRFPDTDLDLPVVAITSADKMEKCEVCAARRRLIRSDFGRGYSGRFAIHLETIIE